MPLSQTLLFCRKLYCFSTAAAIALTVAVSPLLLSSTAMAGGTERTAIVSGDGAVTLKNTTVYFSPRGGCTQAVVKALDAATTSIVAQAYSFTSAPIAKALVDAHKRGVSIQVILDKSNQTANYSSADFVAHAGIPTFIDAAHAIAHNKIMVIDGHTVITGSFNFTKAAEEKNAENLLIIDDLALAARYIQNWRMHLQHSTPYQGR